MKWTEAFMLLDQQASTCITSLYNGFSPECVFPVSYTQIRDANLSLAWCRNSVN